ncbi:hypothetical protein MTP99_015711 [Tenebrio molitor]|jgi:hypothetical protein|nr:hypothetical protein MTP99_015711 [Tenebrio molitor]
MESSKSCVTPSPSNNVTVKEKMAIRNLNKKEDLVTHKNSELQGQNYYLLQSFLPYWSGYQKKINVFAMARDIIPKKKPVIWPNEKTSVMFDRECSGLF